MKLKLLLLCMVEALILSFAVSPKHYNSREVTKAYSMWKANPSPDTEAAFLREKRSYEIEQFAIETVLIWLPFIANTTALVLVARRLLLDNRDAKKLTAIRTVTGS